MVIIRTSRTLNNEKFNDLYEDLLEMYNNGLILLPNYCDFIYASEYETAWSDTETEEEDA